MDENGRETVEGGGAVPPHRNEFKVRYLFLVFLVLVGIATLATNVFSSTLYFLAAFLIMEPGKKAFKARPRTAYIYAFLFWLTAGIVNLAFLPDDKSLDASAVTPPSAAANLSAAAVNPAAIPTEQAKRDFAENRGDILSWLREMNEKGQFVAAVAWGKPYDGIGDQEFQKLYDEAKAGGIRLEERNAVLDAGRALRERQFKKMISQATSSSAANHCQSLVKAQLKSPKTAKFEFGPAVIPDQSNFSFNVSSYVDSENSLGGMVRTHYQCGLEYVDGKKWNVINIVLSEP